MRRGALGAVALAGSFSARRWAIAWTLMAAFAALLLGAASAGAGETPEKDPFYKAPQPGEPHENWREEPAGTILKQRALNIFGYNAEQLLFRSNNAHDEPIVAVTTIGIPRNPWLGR